jgi:4-hydroxy 2-oxovalerate aldolase
MKTQILDCTIRDGGHLNQWQFDPTCVKAAYYAALKSGVDYFEAGYRYPSHKRGMGPFAYSTDELLTELFVTSDSCKLAVMIDAGKSETSQFQECRPEKTPLRAVRVAAYPYELDKATGMVEELHDLGYEVFLNLMASSELSEANYAYLTAWYKKNLLSGIYFADSFGSFIPRDISAQMSKLRNAGFERVGFHSHNNLQMAFANTLRAIEEGAACVDASIYGMGRGAGNLPIEILLGYLEKAGETEYNTVPYLDVIERYFLKLFGEIGWGYGLEALTGGLANIHPYYAESLFKNKLYTVEEIWNALQLIKERCPISFSVDKLGETLEQRFYTPLTPERTDAVHRALVNELNIIAAPDAKPADRFPLQGQFKGRKFLILATGPSILEHRDRILELSKKENCVTIGVNGLQKLFAPDFHVFVSRKRFQQYAAQIAPGSTLLVPSFFGKELVEHNYAGPYHFFDIVTRAKPESAPVEGATQYCLGLNVAISAILLAYAMGASTVYAVGMDGYADEFNKRMVYFYNEDSRIEDKDAANFRYETLARELDRVNTFLQGQSVPFFILTPTSHKKYYRPLPFTSP